MTLEKTRKNRKHAMLTYMMIRLLCGNANEPRSIKWGLAVPVMAIALSGCQLTTDDPGKQDQTKNDKAAVPAKVQTSTVQDIAVDRKQLLLAVNDATSAAATGVDDTSVQASLFGRQFILKLPLGCSGESDAASGWIYDEASQRLTVKATPDMSLVELEDILPSVPSASLASIPPIEDAAAKVESAPVAATTDSLEKEKSAPSSITARPNKIEAVDGFWIPRPWIFTDTCPVEPNPNIQMASDKVGSALADNNAAKTTTEIDPIDDNALSPTIGIAHFYTARDPRVGRRNGQAYRITKRVTEKERPNPQSLRLVLRGRLGMLPGGKVIQCSTPKDTSRPRCVISASFDRVSFENANGSIIYAEWGGG